MKKLRVVICGGDDGEAWLHRQAWVAADAAELHGLCGAGVTGAGERASAWGCAAYESFGRVLDDPAVDIVVLLEPMPGRADAAVAALERKKHVLLGAPFASNSEQARRIAAAAARAGRALMCFENWHFFPPVRKIFRLLDKKTVGRVTALRMRSIIAGCGGWDEWLNPEFTAHGAPGRDAPSILFRECYEKLSLALRMLGPIEELFYYCPPAGGGAGGAAVLTWKHAAPATYGALDVTFAPDMCIRSATWPRDDNMELTGSAGIIWLTRACSQMRNEPAVRVFRGENLFSYGNLDDNWQQGHAACAREFAERVSRGQPPPLDVAHSVRAVEAAEAAARSAESASRIRLAAPAAHSPKTRK